MKTHPGGARSLQLTQPQATSPAWHPRTPCHYLTCVPTLHTLSKCQAWKRHSSQPSTAPSPHTRSPAPHTAHTRVTHVHPNVPSTPPQYSASTSPRPCPAPSPGLTLAGPRFPQCCPHGVQEGVMPDPPLLRISLSLTPGLHCSLWPSQPGPGQRCDHRPHPALHHSSRLARPLPAQAACSLPSSSAFPSPPQRLLDLPSHSAPAPGPLSASPGSLLVLSCHHCRLQSCIHSSARACSLPHRRHDGEPVVFAAACLGPGAVPGTGL